MTPDEKRAVEIAAEICEESELSAACFPELRNSIVRAWEGYFLSFQIGIFVRSWEDVMTCLCLIDEAEHYFRLGDLGECAFRLRLLFFPKRLSLF